MKVQRDGLLNRDFVFGTAVAAFSFLAILLIPPVGAFVSVVMPLPFLFYFTKYGRMAGAALVGISLALAFLILNIVDADTAFPLLPFLLVGLTGWMLSEVLKKSWSVEKTVLVPAAVLLVCSGLLLLLHAYQSGLMPWQLVENYFQNSVRENIRLYEQLDISSEQTALIKDHVGQIAALLTHIFPAVVAVGICLAIWLNLSAARFLFKKHGVPHPDFGDLTCWKAPEKLVWMLIATGGMLLMPVAAVRYAGLNLLILCLFVYLAAGLSIIGYFFKVKRVSLFFRALFYMLILVQQYVMLLVVALGLFDLWADFRRMIRPASDANG